MDGEDRALRRPSRAARSRHGGAERTPLPGLARRLFADRTPRFVRVLRGLCPHRGFDVQPACQVAQGVTEAAVAAVDCFSELPPYFARLAAGPQWLHAPGSWVRGPGCQQEGGYRAHISGAR